MNRLIPLHVGFRFWTGLLAAFFLTFVFGLYFVDVSAQTEAFEKTADQNLIVGRLAVTRFAAGSPESLIFTYNPDGSGGFMLPVSSSLTPAETNWSPDGTKIAYATFQPPWDIFVINADGSGITNLTNTAAPINERNPSWSVNGLIAYERRPNSGGTPTEIWTMNADGTGQAQFTAITQPSPSGPTWSPDGTKLAFSSAGDIWVINADGTGQRRVMFTGSADIDPAWSPDGTKIVFGKGGSGVAVINEDGTNETVLTSSAADKQPAWSPDGTKIAYSGGDGLYTMNGDGTNKVRILANVINFPNCCDLIYQYPAWQPVSQEPNTFNISGRVTYNNLPLSGVSMNLTGSTTASTTTDAVGNYQFSGLPAGGQYTVSPSRVRHYFTPTNGFFFSLLSNQTADFEVLAVCQGGQCLRNGRIAFTQSGEIFVINPDGTSKINITNNAANDTEPNYSPDGFRIAFATDRDGNNEIYRMQDDGAGPVRLTNNAASDTSPYYSPDGASIVFVSDRDGDTEIYKMNANGSNQVRLTTTGNNRYPAFSHDGQKIIFYSGNTRKLVTMNTDGSNQQAIPDPNSPFQGYERSSYSPDGSKIIFTYTTDTSAAPRLTWTMNSDGSNRVLFPADGRLGTYSPDGTKVVYTCCQFDNTNRVRTANADGSSQFLVTTSGFGYDLPDWQPIRVTSPTPFDFDGDGRADLSVFRPSNGAWYLLRSTAGLWVPVWGISTDVPVPADYDGDRKTDVAVWRPSDGNFYVLNSSNSTVRVENFGLAGDVPTGGDWDGDGKADVAVWRGGAQGVFYYRGSMGNPNGNITSLPWGTTGDKPVAGDYDGDGITDAAIYRNGVWWIRNSSNGQSSAYNFGLTDDTLVPADYDADGKTDLAVYRAGIWYLLRSTQGFTAFQFGIASDIPAPADFDGDGRADATIYRDGAWWILRSQTGSTQVHSWGLGTDKPIPSAYVR